MRKSMFRRAIVISTATVVGVAGLAFIAAPASAHIVTGMEATCTRVIVHFNYFPDGGVPVTLVVKVGNAPAITKVVDISSSKTQAHVNISNETSQLFGSTVDVTVDETWTLHGQNHESQKLSVTCGSATTTSTSTSTSTTSTSTTSTSTTSSTTTTSTTTTTTQPKPPPPTNGNIFQVELRRCTQVHIGYQHFPVGTVIYWRVKQGVTNMAYGHLTTAAGSGYHFFTQNLGKTLRPAPQVGYIYYTWAIRGMKHALNVIREPGCTGTTPVGAAGRGDIFTVDLRNCNMVHLGYQYFPVNTNVTWMIKQAGIPKASGYFITTSGAGYHFLMEPIGYKIASKTPADLTFYWMQGSTPLHYSVRKAPGC